MKHSECVSFRPHPLALGSSVARAACIVCPTLVALALLVPVDTPFAAGWLYGPFALTASLLLGIRGWLKERYCIEEGELVVTRGILGTDHLRIPLWRIRQVNLTRNPHHRWLGIARVQLHLGNRRRKLRLAVLHPRTAELLKCKLTVSETPFGYQAPTLEWTLSPARLMASATTAPLFIALLAAAPLAYLLMPRHLAERAVHYLAPSAQVHAELATTTLLLLLLAWPVLAWFVAVLAHVIRFGGFRAECFPDRLIISLGLLGGRETSVPLERIQAIRNVETFLSRGCGLASISVEVLGRDGTHSWRACVHPALRRSELVELLAELQHGYPLECAFLRSPQRALLCFLLQPLAIAGILAAFVLALSSPSLWLTFALAPALWAAWSEHQNTGVAVGHDQLGLRTGGLRRVTTLIHRNVIQHVDVRQSLLQRKLGLSTFSVGIPGSRPARAPCLPCCDASLSRSLVEWVCGDGVAPATPWSNRPPTSRRSIPPPSVQIQTQETATRRGV